MNDTAERRQGSAVDTGCCIDHVYITDNFCLALCNGIDGAIERASYIEDQWDFRVNNPQKSLYFCIG